MNDVTEDLTPKEERRHVPLLKALGPGFVTGAADDDPSGIATYSQAGAQFGYGLLWSVLFTTPLMIAIQIVSARIGRVTGHGLAANIREGDRRQSPFLSPGLQHWLEGALRAGR